MKINILLYVIMSLILIKGDVVYAHDTTHIHPLITAEIAQLIEDIDNATMIYSDIYIQLADEDKDSTIPTDIKQRRYWGTDFDPKGLAEESNKTKYLLEDQIEPYHHYNNVIDGVVQEDVPVTKVYNHFYHARTGKGLTDSTETSEITAMRFFNESIARMGGYTEAAKHTALS